MKVRKAKTIQRLRKEHETLKKILLSLKANRFSKADNAKIAQVQKELKKNRKELLGLTK